MRVRGPIRTSPESTAVGATDAVGSTIGRRPRCSISILADLSERMPRRAPPPSRHPSRQAA
jgi:hypothetical protein